jgi:hypothetical protein
VNPTQGIIAIRKYHKFMKDVQKIDYDDEGDCEFYSKELVKRLSKMIGSDDDSTYAIPGVCYNGYVVIFKLENAEAIERQDDL